MHITPVPTSLYILTHLNATNPELILTWAVQISHHLFLRSRWYTVQPTGWVVHSTLENDDLTGLLVWDCCVKSLFLPFWLMWQFKCSNVQSQTLKSAITDRILYLKAPRLSLRHPWWQMTQFIEKLSLSWSKTVTDSVQQHNTSPLITLCSTERHVLFLMC